MDVAVKKIGSAFKNAEEGKRLLREIKLIKHFNHENVTPQKQTLGPNTKKTLTNSTFYFKTDHQTGRDIEAKDIRTIRRRLFSNRTDGYRFRPNYQVKPTTEQRACPVLYLPNTQRPSLHSLCKCRPSRSCKPHNRPTSKNIHIYIFTH